MKRAVKRNIQRMTLIQGTVRGNKGGYAFLAREDGGKDLFIPHANLGGAQHGDRVKVRIVRGDECEVVKIVERGIERLSGELCIGKGGYFVKPDLQSYYSTIDILSTKGAAVGEKVYCAILSYQGGRPQGKVLSRLGKSGEESTEILSTLYGNGFSDTFPARVLQAADELQAVSYEGREDLRDLPTITIDGEDARDFDDAISVKETQEGFVLWVHIADVSAYVKEGSPVDIEAYKRGTSVYFPKQAYPMLPEKLSNGLCSLREGEDKATVTVKMTFDREGVRKSAEACLSVIRSNHRMTYTQVQSIFDGVELDAFQDVYPLLFAGRALAAALNQKRAERGSIDFGAADTDVLIADDRVIGVNAAPNEESNRLIEAFMIAANEAVAETLENAGYPCAYRVHEEPTAEKLKQLSAFAACFMEMPSETLKSGEISAFLARCEELGESGAIVAKVAIKCMQKAKYAAENVGHYGLASECYCHFTSPIRRYPDLMVHRILKRYISGKPFLEPNHYVESLRAKCEDCSERERAAERADRDITDYYKAVYMADHVGEEFEGVVSGVTSNWVFVTLPSGVEGCIRVDDIPDTFYLDDLRFTLVGDVRRYRIGDSVQVTVLQADILARRVYFAFTEDYQSGNMGKFSYIEAVGNLRPLTIPSFEKNRSRGSSSSNGKKGQSRTPSSSLARDHRKPRSKKRKR